jgi:hypothetical protein
MSGSYSHAGVSKQNGEFKVRFANDVMRQKVLIKNGHTDIDIIELKHPMTKADAVAYLLSINFDNGNKTVRAALEAAADKRSAPAGSKVVAKAAPKAKAKKTTVADTVMAEAKAKVQTKAEAHAKILAEVGEALV